VTSQGARLDSTPDRLARFEALYDAHRRPAFGLAYAVLGDASEAEDALQEAFLSAWRAGIPVEPESQRARCWILTIVRRRAIDVRRRRLRRPAIPLGDETEVPMEAPDVPDQAALAVDAGVVSGCLADLPPEQRQVVELAYFSGLTHGEIAEREHLPLGTVKSRIRLALDRLRAMFNAGRDSARSP
jgi:RNA polymerase sigma-70 factor, ECF subfamily